MRRNIIIYYAISFLKGIMFFVPIIVLFWKENGLNYEQITLLQSLYVLFAISLEVPTGYFADKIGRARAMQVAILFYILSEIIYGFGNSFLDFLIAELLWATAVSLNSGSNSALLYDTLKILNEEHAYKKIEGTAKFLELIGNSISFLTGSMIAKINMRLTFFLEIPFLILALILALHLKEAKIKNTKKSIINWKSIARLPLKNKLFAKWLVFNAFVFVAIQASFWFYQPYFLEVNISIDKFGWIYALIAITAGVSAKYAHILENKMKIKNIIALLLLLVVIAYSISLKYTITSALLFVVLLQISRGAINIIFLDTLNKLIPSKIRASALSLVNMTSGALYALILPFFGKIADSYGIYRIFYSLTIYSALLFIIYIRIKEHMFKN